MSDKSDKEIERFLKLTEKEDKKIRGTISNEMKRKIREAKEEAKRQEELKSREIDDDKLFDEEKQQGEGLTLKAFQVIANENRKGVKGVRKLDEGELHYKNSNFMGPGTKWEKYKNYKPYNRPDAVAKIHDKEYHEVFMSKTMSKKEKAEAIRRADNKMIASLKALGKLEGEEEEYRQAGLKGIQFKRGLENVSQSLAKKLLGEWAGKPLKKIKPKKIIKKAVKKIVKSVFGKKKKKQEEDKEEGQEEDKEEEKQEGGMPKRKERPSTPENQPTIRRNIPPIERRRERQRERREKERKEREDYRRRMGEYQSQIQDTQRMEQALQSTPTSDEILPRELIQYIGRFNVPGERPTTPETVRRDRERRRVARLFPPNQEGGRMTGGAMKDRIISNRRRFKY